MPLAARQNLQHTYRHKSTATQGDKDSNPMVHQVRYTLLLPSLRLQNSFLNDAEEQIDYSFTFKRREFRNADGSRQNVLD